MRRTVATLAVPLLLLTLAACSTESPPEEGPSDPPVAEQPQDPSDGGKGSPAEEETPTADETSAEETTAEETTAEETTAEETTAEEKSPSVEESPSDEPAGTAIESLWVDDSWTIEDVDEDLCASGISESAFSEQEDMFACGPTAAGAEACALEGDQEVLCIVNALDKQAIRFDSPTAADPSTEVWPAGQDPVPLYVELPEGVTCSTVSHDHDQHWNGLFSWFVCDDGSELLTEDTIVETFAHGDGDLWTVRRSVDKAEPEETRVVSATFAGR